MICQECGEDADELFRRKIKDKVRKLCEDCVGLLEEQQQIAADAQGAMRNLMEYKG